MRGQQVFNSFMIIVGAVVLWLLPITPAIYDFRTDLRTDTFLTTTAVGITSANETLLDDLFNNDVGSVSIISDNTTDTPLGSSYNATSRALLVIGLSGNATRTLGVSYDVQAFEVTDAINALLDKVWLIWMLIIIGFAPAALLALFLNR